jgi:hypothetical protein
MRKIREVLRLSALGLAQHQIAASCSSLVGGHADPAAARPIADAFYLACLQLIPYLP